MTVESVNREAQFRKNANMHAVWLKQIRATAEFAAGDIEGAVKAAGVPVNSLQTYQLMAGIAESTTLQENFAKFEAEKTKESYV